MNRRPHVCVHLTLTASVPVGPADSQSALPAHPETSAVSLSGYEIHPAGHTHTRTPTQ